MPYQKMVKILFNNLRVEWHLNLPMAPWHDGFFERFVRSVKELLRKELKCYRLSYEELQTVLFEIECILNNRPIEQYRTMPYPKSSVIW